MCARMGALRSLGSELLDPSTVTQFEVQVGHRYTVCMYATLTVNISKTKANINKQRTARENLEKK